MSLSGTQLKKEPLVGKDSSQATISALCSFLYILDTSAFPLEVIEAKMYKKRTFYTYAHIEKYSATSTKIAFFIFIQ